MSRLAVSPWSESKSIRDRHALEFWRDRGNAAAYDGDIGRHRRRAAAVDDLAAADEDIGSGHGLILNPLRPLGGEGANPGAAG